MLKDFQTNAIRKVIKRLCDRAEQGFLRRNRQKSGPDEVTSLTVIDAVALNPQISTRQIERQYGISKSTANRVLKLNKFHPYHIHLTQQEERDYQRRVRFCNWLEIKFNKMSGSLLIRFFLMEPRFVIEEALIDITAIIIQMLIHIGREAKSSNGSGPLTFGQASWEMLLLVHIFLKKISMQSI